jgi:hypothetical protein
LNGIDLIDRTSYPFGMGYDNKGVSFAGGGTFHIVGRNFAHEPAANIVYFKTDELSSAEITFAGPALT